MGINDDLRAMRRRLELGIERNYLIAMARLEGVTPEEYAAKLDAERLEAHRVATRAVMEQAGAAYRGFYEAIREAVEAFSRGWNQFTR